MNDTASSHDVTASWAGVWPAAMTMFDDDDRFDGEATAAHIEWLVAQGAHGVVVGGTSGEFIGLSDDERRRLFTVSVAAAGGRVPVVAGSGAYSTRATIDLTHAAADAGASGVIVILPYYQKPAPGEVFEHFALVGRESPLPVVAYNNPGNTLAPALTAQSLAALYERGAIHAVKSTFPTVHQVHEALAVTDEGFRVFYGSFMAPMEGIAGGAHGWISGILNVVMPDALALWGALQRGDLHRARSAWARILPIKQLYTNQRLGALSDLAIYRAILDLRGRHGGRCRRPLLDLNDVQRQELATMLPLDDTEGSDMVSAGAETGG